MSRRRRRGGARRTSANEPRTAPAWVRRLHSPVTACRFSSNPNSAAIWQSRAPRARTPRRRYAPVRCDTADGTDEQTPRELPGHQAQAQPVHAQIEWPSCRRLPGPDRLRFSRGPSCACGPSAASACWAGRRGVKLAHHDSGSRRSPGRGTTPRRARSRRTGR